MRITTGILAVLMLAGGCYSQYDENAKGEGAEDDFSCPKGEIHCSSYDDVKCIPLSRVCDQIPDCAMAVDEKQEFCEHYKMEYYYWRHDCDQGLVKCTRYGVSECLTPMEYCSQEIPCTGNLDYRVCRILQAGRLPQHFPYSSPEVSRGPGRTDLHDSLWTGKEFAATSHLTLLHEDCPQLYTKVGEECLSFLFVVNTTWGEAVEFCNLIGGDLLTIRDLDHYSLIRNHLHITNRANDFWIGGRFVNNINSTGWQWLNGDQMPIGFPMWAMRYEEECQDIKMTSLLTNNSLPLNDGRCYHYSQAPRIQQQFFMDERNTTQCVSMTFEFDFRFSDEDCLTKRSPICLARAKEEKEGP